jgi:choline dehydrogenase-like flavoprotein
VTSMHAENVVVGAGVCGLLVARELARAGEEVAILERGAKRSHAEQLRDERHEGTDPLSADNHEDHPASRQYPWTYVYGVGGSTLAWAGVAPRFQPSDFALHSMFGVGRDWPLGYDELVPWYEEAEDALHVAGAAEPAHPLAPVDKLLAPHLQPYGPLPQSRYSRPANGFPACTRYARCHLCPPDARYTGLHTLALDGLEEAGVRLQSGTAVTRLGLRANRVTDLDCVDVRGERFTLRPKRVILAAGGFENAALLLRSDLGGPDVGRWLSDHEHRILELELDVETGHGHGATPATGVSYAFASDEARSRRGAVIVMPVNPGLEVGIELRDALVAGERGPVLRERLRHRFVHTLVLDSVGEDLPRADRFLELSPRRDAFGVPLNRVHYPPDSDYLERGHSAVAEGMVERLEGLGARLVRTFGRAGGAHQLGTCFMGADSGVVDPNLRHHQVENLYVAGGSAFPTYSAAHPTLTIAALAIRLGRHLAGPARGASPVRVD